jgi:hypothetical protein
MNAYVEQNRMTEASRRHAARAPWITALLSPIVFVVLMETFEVIGLSGVLPDVPDAVGLPIYFALVALLPAATIALGIRAIRRGDRGLPWIPTALGVVMVIGLLVMIVSAIVVG